ncbi:hypothetical protein AOLI_G00064900 [Acnodon oligacanthus]
MVAAHAEEHYCFLLEIHSITPYISPVPGQKVPLGSSKVLPLLIHRGERQKRGHWILSETSNPGKLRDPDCCSCLTC